MKLSHHVILETNEFWHLIMKTKAFRVKVQTVQDINFIAGCISYIIIFCAYFCRR